MRATLCVLLVAGCALAIEANEHEARGSKRPYVADAVGNTLPPPSNLPATVGSPVNLISPDRYEFYTFDESGELVKRLMTLEEIQGIVAAGEEAEGLVTFANDNQPTIAFNFSQPPYTKVHNVVTNVQNVLKAQMEAHKNKPHFQPTLDTPDVSDTWSLILPSIFGNTGVDIVPDKIQNSGTFTTPETETIILDQQNPEVDEIMISKEGSNQVISSSTTLLDEEVKAAPVTEKLPATIKEVETDVTTSTVTTTTTTSTTTTTTPKPTTTSTTTTRRPVTTTTTAKPTRRSTTTTSTTRKPTTSALTTTRSKPIVTTTTETTTIVINPSTTIPTTTARPHTVTETTAKPRVTTTSTSTITTTTAKPTTTTGKPTTTPKTVRITPKTTAKPTSTTEKSIEDSFINNKIQTLSNKPSTTEKSSIQYDKISTFIPISTVAYITERTTQNAAHTTKREEISLSTTKNTVTSTTKLLSTTTPIPSSAINSQPTTSSFVYISSTTNPNQKHENDKVNITTITTQSISPSTTVSSTEVSSGGNSLSHHLNDNVSTEENNDNVPIPLFDVAQSISQIASDLNGNFGPIPTTSNLLDTTKFSNINLESKENSEMDIPTDSPTEPDTHVTDSNGDNFVKISTLDPHAPIGDRITKPEEPLNDELKSRNKTTENVEVTTVLSESTTIDPFLSDSMDDLLSQVVNEQSQTIVTEDKESSNDINTTTEIKSDTITTESSVITTIASSVIPFEITNDATEKSENTSNIPKIENRITETKISFNNDVKQSKPESQFTTEKIENKNTEKTENYVQISVSHDKIESTSASPSTVVSLNKTTQNDGLSDDQDLKVEKEAVSQSTKTDIKPTTESTKVYFTTKSFKPIEAVETSTLAQPLINKFNLENNNNKLTNKNEKVKVPELLPKIDDFKKKIQKVNIDDKELAAERNNSWKLISTVSPPKTNEISKDKLKNDGQHSSDNIANKDINLDFSKENQGLEVTTKDLGEDIAQFTELCNELAFRYWNAVIENIDKRRSFVLSPYSITSMLAMMFMGARGATSGEMNEVLKLDDMVTFNPHFTLKNISDSIETSPEAGVIVSAFIRELYSDKNKGKILRFYKERAQQFYNGHVEEIDFKMIGDKIRRRTNLLVKRYTWGKISEYVKTDTINMQPPLAAFSANIFETDCSGSSVEGRDGEMYFVVSPNVRQRRLVPVPAVVYRTGFLAGYDPVLDATAAALGNTHSVISTLFLMPGQQGNVVHSEDLEALERRLLDSNPSTPTWNRLLRTLLPRIGLELQIPRFSHKSVFNVSSTLKRMGLKDLFDAEHADLGGLNGPSKDLYLSDMIQSTTFVTCGEGIVGDQHHMEAYPETVGLRRRTSRWATDWDEPRDYQRAFHDPHDVGDAMHLPLHLRPRQARLPARNAQPARLRFDRPFLYFVRHNPSGMILYVGRYNPRLLP